MYKRRTMKKLLLGLLLLGLTSNSYAGVISYTALTSDAGVSYAHFNTAFSTIYNDYNGNIATANILNGTITDADLATAVKLASWYTESIGDWTYSGMLPATDTDLTSDISAGTSYVQGNRILTDATAHTYTASKDTWVYIDKNGTFQYSEVGNGNSQPTTPTDSLLLAKAVTNGTAITSVTDLRQLTPPNLRIYQNYRQGLAISRDPDTATKINVLSGEIEFGSTGKVRRNTGTTNVDFTTNGISGLDTSSLAAGIYYIFALPDADNSVNYEAIASTSNSGASGVTGERLIGWVYAPSASAISVESVGSYKGLGETTPNIAYHTSPRLTRSIANGSVATPISNIIQFYSSGRPVMIDYSFFGVANGGEAAILSVSIDSAVLPETERIGDINSTSAGEITGKLYKNLNAGVHTFQLKVGASGGNTIESYGYSLIIEEK